MPKTCHELKATGTHVASSMEQQAKKRKEYVKVFQHADKKNSERTMEVRISVMAVCLG